MVIQEVRGRLLKWGFGALVLAACSVGGGYYLAWGGQSTTRDIKPTSAPSRPEALQVQVIHPQRREVERTTTQPGSVHAFESVQLYAGVSGYLKSLNVDIGDRVKKGQPLAQVDVPDLVKQAQRCAAALEQARARVIQMGARVVSAKADLEAARATVPQAEALAKSKAAELRFRQKQLERMRDLFASKSIDERLVDEKTEQRDAAREAEISAREGVSTAKAKVDSVAAQIKQAEADVTEAEAEVRVAQAELEKADVLVGFATVVAPFDGVITQRNYFPFDYVRTPHESAGSVPLLTVQRMDLMRVVVQIPDRDVPLCDAGDKAIVEIDALSDQQIPPAKVSRVSRSEDPETRLMRVEIDLPNPIGKICNGMYGRVTIILDRAKLPTIPSGCLITKAKDGKASVCVVRNGRAHFVPVTVESDDGLTVAIRSGIADSDEIVLNPSSGLVDGIAVQSRQVKKD